MKRILLLLACLVPRAAHAQLSADSLSLARAVATMIEQAYMATSDSILPLRPESPFDSAVVAELRERGRFRRVFRDETHVTRVGTQGVMGVLDSLVWSAGLRAGVVRDSVLDLGPGTTVTVIVQDRGSIPVTPENEDGITGWISRWAYIFRRAADEWSLVRRMELGTADLGSVRDDSEPRHIRVRKDGG